MVLEKDASPDQVQWVSERAADDVGGERGNTGNECQHFEPISARLLVAVVSVLVFVEFRQIDLDKAINGVKGAREWHVSDQGNSNTSEEALHTFLIVDLFGCIINRTVFVEPNHFKSSFNNDQWVEQNCLQSSRADTGRQGNLCIAQGPQILECLFKVIQR